MYSVHNVVYRINIRNSFERAQYLYVVYTMLVYVVSVTAILHANTSATCSAEHTMDLNTHMHALTNGIPLSVQPVQARSLTHLYLSTTRTV